MPVPSPDVPERTLLRDQVQQQIRAAILDGTLQPGERLNDNDLIGWLNVSRTPIREALAALAKEGLIEMVPNRYTRVVEPTDEDARNAVRALGILLGSIIRITLPTMITRQRQHVLKRIDRRVDELTAGGTGAIVRTVDEGYHAWIDLCPNPALADVVRQRARGLAFAYRVDTIDQIIPAGELITRLGAYRDAIAAADADTAAAAIETAHTPAPTTDGRAAFERAA